MACCACGSDRVDVHNVPNDTGKVHGHCDLCNNTAAGDMCLHPANYDPDVRVLAGHVNRVLNYVMNKVGV